MAECDIGLVGLAVMGENLVLNMESRGFRVAVYNRTASVTDAFTSGGAKGKNIVGFHDLASLVKSLKRPRRVMMMVKAGGPVDDVIKQLIPLLEKGDVIIDGGNSHFNDSQRRYDEVTKPACCISAPACRVVKKVHSKVRASCRADQ